MKNTKNTIENSESYPYPPLSLLDKSYTREEEEIEIKNTNWGRDEYFAEAGRFIIEKNKASIGLLQRVFKIGFNRAAKIMDQLAEAGVVSEESSTRARQVLMTMAEFEQFLEEEL